MQLLAQNVYKMARSSSGYARLMLLLLTLALTACNVDQAERHDTLGIEPCITGIPLDDLHVGGQNITEGSFNFVISVNGVLAFRIYSRHIELIEVIKTEDDNSASIRTTDTGINGFHMTWASDGSGFVYAARTDEGIALFQYDSLDGMTSPLKIDAPARGPKWSPNGQYIAYDADGLRIYDLKTEEIFNVTNEQVGEFVWSPDSRTIVFEKHLFTSDHDLYSYSLSTDQEVRLTHTLACEFLDDWVPGTNKVAYIAADSEGHRDIFLTDVVGSQSENLTQSAMEELQLAWSPTGEYVAVVVGEGNFASGSQDLFLLAADGSVLQRLTDNADWYESAPVWSADGQSLYFVAVRFFREPSNKYQQWRIDQVHIPSMSLETIYEFQSEPS